MIQSLERLAPLFARALLSGIFIVSGAGKIFDWEGTAGYMAAYGVPLIPLLLALTIVIEIGGGVSILVGYKARWGALALVGFLIPTTLVFHAFWAVPAEEQMIQTVMFMKNLTIMGGLLLLFGKGPGEVSFDCRADAKAC